MAHAKEVTASITAQNTGTAALAVGRHPFNMSLSGTWVATVFVQRTRDNGTTWLDVDSFTANIEATIVAIENSHYRLFVKTGGFTSGTVVSRLGY